MSLLREPPERCGGIQYGDRNEQAVEFKGNVSPVSRTPGILVCTLDTRLSRLGFAF